MANYKGFYKVACSGFGVESCTFFNPETGEHFTKIVWDIDNDRLLDDDTLQVLRFLPIDDNNRKIWTIYVFLIWYDIYFGSGSHAPGDPPILP